MDVDDARTIGARLRQVRSARQVAAIEAVRRALMAVGRDRPGGQVVPLDALRARVTATLAAHYSCRQDSEVGAALSGLIRDLHTSIAAGRDVAQLLELAVLLHAGATPGWLRVAGAPLDLRAQAAQLAPTSRRRHGASPTVEQIRGAGYQGAAREPGTRWIGRMRTRPPSHTDQQVAQAVDGW